MHRWIKNSADKKQTPEQVIFAANKRHAAAARVNQSAGWPDIMRELFPTAAIALS